MAFLSGKRALIIGLATERSIAYGIAEAMRREGAELAFTYQDRFKDRVEGMAAEFGSKIVLPMDVADDAQIEAAFTELGKTWDGIDIIVHAVAFAPTDAIRGSYVESTTRENFRIAHDISSYSLTAIAKAALPLMKGRAGAFLTLTYLGAARSLPSYNVMGLAKASLEASVRFLAGSARSWDTSRPLPPFVAMSPPKTSAMRRRSCAQTSPRGSRAKSSTWTAGSARWAWPSRKRKARGTGWRLAMSDER
jgi:enoyl-[acyl-carrier protein] reductase I